ncbi:PIN domain-containing protein [Candidatus Electronema sp. JC]|uniref:PIN domain-containing protein n=1 Tax=Candidatus Electronema sp. JC TaxID=3401570 RepID=UPI003B4388C0
MTTKTYHARIRLKTNALHLILSKIHDGTYQAVVSRVHLAEVSAIADFCERIEVLALLARFNGAMQADSSGLRSRAEYLHQQGFGLADAAHLAYAEATADVFITCDDKLLKKRAVEAACRQSGGVHHEGGFAF